MRACLALGESVSSALNSFLTCPPGVSGGGGRGERLRYRSCQLRARQQAPWCVFVYPRCSEAELVATVRESLSGVEKYGTIVSAGMVVSVVAIDDYDESRAAGGAGDFLFFPYRVEVEPAQDGDAVTRSALLLEGLRAAGCDFVMDADFEDELPNKGRSRNYTW